VLHTFLPSYASERAVTFLQFNLVMALVSLDLMLCTMAARPFMALNPALLLLVVPLIAHFGAKVSPKVEVYISIGCAAFAFALYLLRMSIVGI
jgi:hypothetical protein